MTSLDHPAARASALASTDSSSRRRFFVRALVLAALSVGVATAMMVVALDLRTPVWFQRPRYPIGSLLALTAAAWAIEVHVRVAPRTIGWLIACGYGIGLTALAALAWDYNASFFWGGRMFILLSTACVYLVVASFLVLHPIRFGLLPAFIAVASPCALLLAWAAVRASAEIFLVAALLPYAAGTGLVLTTNRALATHRTDEVLPAAVSIATALVRFGVPVALCIRFFGASIG